MTDYQSYPQSPAPAPQNSTLAIVSLVAGIASWIIVPLIGAIVAVVTGHMAKKEIRASGDTIGGNGLATAGLILGYVNIILLGIPCCIIVILALLGPSIGNVFSDILLSI